MAVFTPTRVDAANGGQSVHINYGALTTADTGAPIYVGDLEQLVVVVGSAGAGTAQVRGSSDGTSFGVIGSPLAVGATQLAASPNFIDISVVATANLTFLQVSGKKRGS